MLKSKNNQYKIINHNISKLIISSPKHGEVICLVDTFLISKLNQYKWSVKSDKNDLRVKSTYWENGKYKTVFMSRFVMDAPTGVLVDHIDGNTLNNRLMNLRLCSQDENARNLKVRKNSISGYKGVTKTSSGKWRARIRFDKKEYHLGTFENKVDAQVAYDVACFKFHKDFAKPNKGTTNLLSKEKKASLKK